MPLSPGDNLGPYEILAPIGEGGMGVVYRAKDSRLAREVAIKVLGEDFSMDPDRVQRFKREARAAGMLNHPNILAVYDLGTHNGQLYLVTELLTGETLRARLDQGPVPQRKALNYAQQIASGLAAAHDKGVTHRDLKPENLFITQDGNVKILDFGLAKVAVSEELGSDTRTGAGKTRLGSVVGTVGYMSPEQVTGLPADARSDIFSLGVVLYEMLSGRRAFVAPTTVETLAQIVRNDPPRLEAAEPVQKLVLRCLEKDATERFQSARDLSFAMHGLAALDASKISQQAMAATPKRRIYALIWAAGIAVGLAAGLLTGYLLWTRAAASVVFHKITYTRGSISGARFAPDGQTIVYSANWNGRPLETFAVRTEYPESRSLNLASHVVSISKSGELLLLRDPQPGSVWNWWGTLASSPMDSAAPRDLVENVADADYAPDGRIAVALRIDGAAKNRLEFPAGKALYETAWISHIRVSPQGDRVAFLDHPVLGDDGGSVIAVDLAGKKTALSTGWASVQGLAWNPRGDEVWFSAGHTGSDLRVYAATLSGHVRDVLSGVGSLVVRDISRDGKLLVAATEWRQEIHVVREGDTADRDLTWLDLSFLMDISRDGKRVLFNEEAAAMGADGALCIRGTDGSSIVRLGKGGTSSTLSPDGKWALALLPGPPQQLLLTPLGAGQSQVLRSEGKRITGVSWLPDSRRVVWFATEPGKPGQAYIQEIPDGSPKPIFREGLNPWLIPVSPDGSAVPCRGADRVWMRCSLQGAEPTPIPGLTPRDNIRQWTTDGKSLYISSTNELPVRIYKVDVTTGQRQLWKEWSPADLAGVSRHINLRITPDGQAVAYALQRTLSDLFVVEGVK